MSSFPIFDVAGSAMAAQQVRLNAIASNIANAETVAGSADQAYRPKFAHFATADIEGQPGLAGVRVLGVVESTDAPVRRYEPNHPLADPNGYVYAPRTDAASSMVDMISAQRAYQANAEVINTSKELAISTLQLGR